MKTIAKIIAVAGKALAVVAEIVIIIATTKGQR